jgi:hypothetical protein
VLWAHSWAYIPRVRRTRCPEGAGCLTESQQVSGLGEAVARSRAVSSLKRKKRANGVPPPGPGLADQSQLVGAPREPRNDRC